MEREKKQTGMNYIYGDETQRIPIEALQKATREHVINQYIARRKEKHFTQGQLAKRAGIPRSNITRFESGTYNPSLEMMVRIAAALDMRVKVALE